MKPNWLTVCLALSIVVISFSCQKESSGANNTSSNNNQSKYDMKNLIGWWNSTFSTLSYQRFYFGADSSIIQDGSNFGIGLTTGKWWNIGDTVYALATAGVGSGPIPAKMVIRSLTKDTLKYTAPGATTPVFVYYK